MIFHYNITEVKLRHTRLSARQSGFILSTDGKNRTRQERKKSQI